jgi:predicted MPP superfamily phosphohydrolase
MPSSPPARGPAATVGAMDRGRRADRLTLALRWVFVALVGLGGAWLALLALGRADYAVGPFRVEMFARPGLGHTEIAVPPLGRLDANTHVGPIRLTATLQEVGPTEVSELVRHRGMQGLARQVEEEGLAALRVHGWRSLGVAVLGALALGLLIFRLRWRRVLAAGLSGAVLFGASATLAWTTFRPEAFASPTYTGSLALAPQLIGPIREATGRIEDFRIELQRLVAGAVGAYTQIAETVPETGTAVSLLHISDIHSSPLGMDFAQRLAQAFRVDLVVDTGDLTSFGSPPERFITTRIRGFEVPYVFVPGNHDSPATSTGVGAQPNGIVLDGRAEEVAGLTIYGAGHPVFTPDPTVDVTDREFADAARAAGEAVAEDVAALDLPPDIVAVHDDRMAEASAGMVPLVISGHFHQPEARVEEGTVFLRVATTGAGGLDTFTRPEPIPLSAQILYFDGDPLRLVAWDVVTLNPITRDLSVSRHHISELVAAVEDVAEEAEPAPRREPVPVPR